MARGVAAGRWLGWRRRALVVLALLGCVGLFALLRALSATPFVDAAWRTNGDGQLVLNGSGDPQVQKFIGETVLGVVAADGRLLPTEVLLARRSPRWVLDDAERQRTWSTAPRSRKAVHQGAVPLRLAESAATVEVRTVPRGYAGLGSMFWLMTALALVFYLIGSWWCWCSPTSATCSMAWPRWRIQGRRPGRRRRRASPSTCSRPSCCGPSSPRPPRTGCSHSRPLSR